MQWRRKIKRLRSCGERAKEEGNLKDSILEAYVLESLQPVPCQKKKKIYWPGWPVGSHAATDGFCLTPQIPALSSKKQKDISLCGVVILPPSVMHENKPVTSSKIQTATKEKEPRTLLTCVFSF